MFWIPLTYLVMSTLTPGPVTVMTIQNTTRYGRRAGTAVAVGGSAATAAFVALSLLLTNAQASGLSLHTTTFYQQGGALFILMLGLLSGYKSLFANRDTSVVSGESGRLLKSFFVGLGLMAPYLPQALLFYTVILPEHALTSGLMYSILLMGGIKIMLTIGWYTLLAQAANSIQAWFFNQRTQRVVEMAVACLLVGMSLTLLRG